MGWVFPAATLDQLDLPSEGLEMMVVPFVRFPDGSRRELFEYTAELAPASSRRSSRRSTPTARRWATCAADRVP